MRDDNDYYAPHATLRLERPLALIGFMGAGVRVVARGLTARTGLALFDIARDVEADLGMTRSQILLELGRAALDDAEAEAIRRALADGAPGVLALTEGALMRIPTRERIEADAHLVYIERPAHVLLRRIKTEIAAAPACYPEFVIAPPRAEHDIEPLLRAREPAYRAAPTILAVRDLHPHDVVETLLADLRSICT